MTMSLENRKKRRTDSELESEFKAVGELFGIGTYDIVSEEPKGGYGRDYRDMHTINILLPYNRKHDGYRLYTKKKLFAKTTHKEYKAYLKGDVLVVFEYRDGISKHSTVYDNRDKSIIETREVNGRMNTGEEMDKVIAGIKEELFI